MAPGCCLVFDLYQRSLGATVGRGNLCFAGETTDTLGITGRLVDIPTACVLALQPGFLDWVQRRALFENCARIGGNNTALVETVFISFHPLVGGKYLHRPDLRIAGL